MQTKFSKQSVSFVWKRGTPLPPVGNVLHPSVTKRPLFPSLNWGWGWVDHLWLPSTGISAVTEAAVGEPYQILGLGSRSEGLLNVVAGMTVNVVTEDTGSVTESVTNRTGRICWVQKYRQVLVNWHPLPLLQPPLHANALHFYSLYILICSGFC